MKNFAQLSGEFKTTGEANIEIQDDICLHIYTDTDGTIGVTNMYYFPTCIPNFYKTFEAALEQLSISYPEIK